MRDFQREALAVYAGFPDSFDFAFLPVHPYNKKKNGKVAGKSPRDNGWTTYGYKTGSAGLEDAKTWFGAGFNVGFRPGAGTVVVDIDPRNDEAEPLLGELTVQDRLAVSLGFVDFDDLVNSGTFPIVLSGGGGWHVYCGLPSIDYSLYRVAECVSENAGGFGGALEIKGQKRQVVSAGSRHPSGGYYRWSEASKGVDWSLDGIGSLSVEWLIEHGYLVEHGSGSQTATSADGLYGVLTGEQLDDLILSKLDVLNYSGQHDKWLSLMAAAHHATAGNGVDQWVNWCLDDLEYAGDEGSIRSRWDTFLDKRKSGGSSRVSTIASLVYELKQYGQDTNEVRAVLDFSEMSDFDGDSDSGSGDVSLYDEIAEQRKREKAERRHELRENEKTSHIHLAHERFEKEATDLGAELEGLDVVEEVVKEQIYGRSGVQGSINENLTSAIATLNDQSSNDDIMVVIRLILATDTLTAEKAKAEIVDKKVLSRASLNTLLKSVKATESVNQDIANKICKLCLRRLWSNGDHIMTAPDGMQWIYTGKVWIEANSGYVKKLIYSVLRRLRIKGEFAGNDSAMINEVYSLLSVLTATLVDPLARDELPPSMINVLNGELWIDDNTGAAKLKPHNFESKSTTLLEVEFDPSATCPLWDRTIAEIFADVPDDEDEFLGEDERADMIRHVHEILGYTIQPYKNIASFFLWRGPGGDGKSTILKVLSAILQGAYANASVKLLSSGGSNGYEHATSALVGKLATVIEEIPRGVLLDDGGLKMLSELTTLQANPKGKAQFQFQYCAQLIMCSNSWPMVNDVSNGLIRRAHVVPFTRQFDKGDSGRGWDSRGGYGGGVDDKANGGIGRDAGVDVGEAVKLDRDRARKITEDKRELAGVLNHLLAGLQRIRSRSTNAGVGFLDPRRCFDAKREWLGFGNATFEFIGLALEEFAGFDKKWNLAGTGLQRVTLKELYTIYNAWCRDNETPLNRKKTKPAFKLDLIQAGIAVEMGAGNKTYIYGQRLTKWAKEILEGSNMGDFSE